MAENRLISVVAPFFNEEGNVKELHQRLVSVLNGFGAPFEIIFVDDGSTDNSFELMKELTPLNALRLRKKYGQSAALNVGIKRAKGEIIVALDGDLENHPEDIPLLIKKLDEGYDIVSGWRKDRWQKQKLFRRFPSVMANKMISFIVKVKLNDHGCTLKAYRRDLFDHLKFQGEKHRLITAHAAALGAKIAELPVNYTLRKHGSSKYGPIRIFKVLLDAFALIFFNKYAKRPIHFFGGLGFASFLLSFLVFGLMVYLRFFAGITFIETPLPVLSALFLIIGFQFVLMGLLAEIIIQKDNSQKEEEFLITEEVKNV